MISIWGRRNLRHEILMVTTCMNKQANFPFVSFNGCWHYCSGVSVSVFCDIKAIPTFPFNLKNSIEFVRGYEHYSERWRNYGWICNFLCNGRGLHSQSLTRRCKVLHKKVTTKTSTTVNRILILDVVFKWRQEQLVDLCGMATKMYLVCLTKSGTLFLI